MFTLSHTPYRLAYYNLSLFIFIITRVESH